ncbi:MAG: DNA polymerase III subunit delta [Candidatus Cloacimonetes bacterium]|nr:DNA polymerase III subunit delta [Candidatus Cloacimonadota bacterium]
MKNKQIKLKYFQFINEFEKYHKENIFLIIGNDNYQKDSCLDLLRKEFITPGSEDFDTITLYADSSSDYELIEQLESLPFMAKRRVVLLKEFDQLKKNQRTYLEKYLKNPVKTTVLIIVAEKIDNRLSLAQAINSQAVVVECKKPYNNSALLTWLDAELKKDKITMAQNARNFLVNNIELDYKSADNELVKLRLFTHDSNVICLEDVEKTLGQSRESTIYDLQRALGKCNLKESQTVLQNMISSEDAVSIGVMLVAVLTRFFLIIWKIIAFRQMNYKDHEISQNHLHEVFYAFREEYLASASRFNRQQIRNIFSFLLQADTELKSLSMEETTLFLLINRICNA